MAIDTGGRKQPGAEPDWEEILNELEKKIDRLKVLYEQYFMGIEKIEPQTLRKEVSRKLLELTQADPRRTGVRYRFMSIQQKFNTYSNYWNRTLRAIEKGTYFRNVAKAGRDALRRGVELPEELLRSMPEKMRERMVKEHQRLLERAALDGVRRGLSTGAPEGDRRGAQVLDETFSESFDELFHDALEGLEAKPASVMPAVGEQAPRKAPEKEPSPSPAQAKAQPLDDGFDNDFDTAFGQLTGEWEAPKTGSSAEGMGRGAKGNEPKGPAPKPTPRATSGGAQGHPSASVSPGRAAVPGTGGGPSSGRPAPARPAPQPTPAGPASNPGMPKIPPGMDEQSMQALYKRYVQAKKLLGEDTSKIKYEHIVQTVAKQAPHIMEQHKAREVEFAVVIKDDKVILKATPKK